MRTEPLFGSPGMDNLMSLLRAGGMERTLSGTWHYPMSDEWGKANLRCNESAPGDWFKRIVQEASGDSGIDSTAALTAIESCEIAEGIALFATIKWKQGKITYLTAQVFVTQNTDLIDFLSGTHSECKYYRLDFSEEERGNMFDHPFPHLHSIPDGTPRFPWHFRPTISPLLSLLEFVFINHKYERWKRWLIDVHAREHNYPSSITDLSMEEIFEMFKSSQLWARVPENERFVTQLKSAAQNKLIELSRSILQIDTALASLNYWI